MIKFRKNQRQKSNLKFKIVHQKYYLITIKTNMAKGDNDVNKNVSCGTETFPKDVIR